MTASSLPTRHRAPVVYVLAGGLIAGTLDIVYACTFWGVKAAVPAERIFQSVAAGLLGKASFEGGAATAALGLGLHYFIATTMSVVYYLVARRWPLLWQRPVLCGTGYGLILYGVMNYIVVPLSAAGHGGAKDPLWVTLSIVVHMFLIGVPIALATSLAPRREPQ
jgi:putative copper export protein